MEMGTLDIIDIRGWPKSAVGQIMIYENKVRERIERTVPRRTWTRGEGEATKTGSGKGMRQVIRGCHTINCSISLDSRK